MESIFKTILVTSLYASIVGICISIIKTILRNRINPKWHYIIWLILVLKLVIPFGPGSIISLFNTVPQVPQNIDFSHYYETYHKSMEAFRLDNPDIPLSMQVKDTTLSVAATAEKILPYVWAIGAAALLGWLLYTNISLYKKVRKNSTIVPRRLYSILERCKEQFDISMDIPIVIQDIIKTPAIFGIIRPKILVSPDILDLSDNDISYIFLHELAHYQRKDTAANYILLLLQIIHWFNPIIWFCFRKIRQDMEVAADEKVLGLLTGNEQKEYGKALLSLLERFSTVKLAPRLIGMVDDKKNIERRIRMIKMTEFFKSKRRMAVLTAVLCITMLCGVLLTSAAGKTTINDENKSYEIGKYSVSVPSDWTVRSTKGVNNEIAQLSFIKNDQIIGGIEILNYEIGQQAPYLPNHSETKIKKDIEGLVTKAVLYNLDLTQPAASNDPTVKNENHLFLIFEKDKVSYDIFADTRYVSEAELLSIAKSFKPTNKSDIQVSYSSGDLIKLKNPYVGNHVKDLGVVCSLPFAKSFQSLSLQTDKQPYGMTVKYGELVSPGSSIEKVEETFRNNAVLIFVLIDNVDEVTFDCTPGGGKKYSYTRSQLQQNYVKDLRQYAKDKDSLDLLINSLSLRFQIYSEKYSLAISSVPGLKITARYNEGDFKVKYSVNYGRLLNWNPPSPIEIKGNYSEQSISTPVYWSPVTDEKVNTEKISVVAEIRNGTKLIAEKKLSIIRDSTNFVFSIQPSHDIFLETSAKTDTMETDDALKVVTQYFDAFAKADYKTMATLSTYHHNNLYMHKGDVFGMKWAKAKSIKYEGVDGKMRFFIDVDMETAETSALYPEKETSFFVGLVKEPDGKWLIDEYTTG